MVSRARSPPEMTVGQPGLLNPTPRWHKVLGGAASLVLLVLILVEVVPKFASYSHAWAAMTHLDAWWWAAIAGVALVNQISGVWPYQAALPGLRFWDGFLEVETTGAIANTVPAGGAVAIGMTYKMFSTFGFSAVDISTAIIATGIWNFAAKLGLPVAAVALLAITAHPTARVLDAAVAGVVAMVVAAVALWLSSGSPPGPTGSGGWPTVWSTGYCTSSESRPGSDRALPHRVQESDHPHRSPPGLAAHRDDAGQSARGVRPGAHHRAGRRYHGGTGQPDRGVHLVRDRPAGGRDPDHAGRSRDTRCGIHQPDDGVRRQFVPGPGRRSHLAADGVRPADHPGHRDLRHLASPARTNARRAAAEREGPFEGRPLTPSRADRRAGRATSGRWGKVVSVTRSPSISSCRWRSPCCRPSFASASPASTGPRPLAPRAG